MNGVIRRYGNVMINLLRANAMELDHKTIIFNIGSAHESWPINPQYIEYRPFKIKFVSTREAQIEFDDINKILDKYYDSS